MSPSAVALPATPDHTACVTLLRDGCRLTIMAAVAATLAMLPVEPASAAPATKAGHAFLGPAMLGIRTLEQRGSQTPVLLEVDRAHAAAAARVIRHAGGRLLSSQLLVWRIPAAAAHRLLPRLIDARALAGVEPVRRLETPASTTAFADPLFTTEWWRAEIGADALTPPGPGVPITVLDSGLDVTHPEFAGRPNVRLLNPQSLVDSNEDFHGTAVASVAAAPANAQGIVGVYPTAALQSWDAYGLTNADVIEGVAAAAATGPTVINMSFGSAENDPMVEEALLVAFGEGSLLVAASGNEFANGNPLLFPASLPHVLTVAATDEHDQATFFSSSSAAVDLAAPGQDIVAAIPFSFSSHGWESVSGTSFAAPMVTAAAAWVWTVRHGLDNTQLFDLMRFSARDIGAKGFDANTGYGLLDIPAALSQTAPSSDYQEPNDDVEMVKPNGLFEQGAKPLTRPAHGSARITARLDATEDPEDVYRVWVPAHRTIHVSLSGDQNVDLELWRSSTRTVHEQGPAVERDLVAESADPGTAVDTVAGRNTGRRGAYLYVDVFLGKDVRKASYALRITTSRK